jgi:DNA-binding Lrp family transcriptional regulator
MMKAYVLVKGTMGQVEEMAAAARMLPAVTSAEAVFGIYDMIVVAQVSSVRDLGLLVLRGIQSIPGVQETQTCLAVD